MTIRSPEHELNRRRFLAVFSAAGLSAALPSEVTKDMLKNAEEIAGLQFTEEERELMLEGLNEHLADYEKLRAVSIPNSVPPALYFNPVLPGTSVDGERRPIRLSEVRVDSVPQTLHTTGHALLVTSIVLSLSFFIYAFASLTNLARFGLITGATIIFAFVADVTLSPALMALSTRGDRLAAKRHVRIRRVWTQRWQRTVAAPK